MEFKKGIPLNQAFGAVLMLVLIGVLVIIAIFLFVTLGDSFTDVSASVTNETEAWINQSGYTLAAAGSINFNSPSISALWNATDNGTGSYNYSIALTNVTVSDAGVMLNASDLNYENVSVSYSYLWGGEAGLATNTMVVQFGNFPVLVGLIGTIIFLGLVIGVLVASFAFGGRRGSGV